MFAYNQYLFAIFHVDISEKAVMTRFQVTGEYFLSDKNFPDYLDGQNNC